jgi:hypothetical protein
MPGLVSGIHDFIVPLENPSSASPLTRLGTFPHKGRRKRRLFPLP